MGGLMAEIRTGEASTRRFLPSTCQWPVQARQDSDGTDCLTEWPRAA